MNLRFLTRSATHHELMLLLTVHRRDGLRMPVNPAELPAGALEQVPLSRLIEAGTLARVEDGAGVKMALTPEGLQHLRRLVIDYHLELMELRRTSDDFVAERVRMLVRRSCQRVILYGASDTARVLLEFLKGSSVTVVAILDDDPDKQGRDIGDVRIIGPADIGRYEFDSIVVTTVAFQDEILHHRASLVPQGKRLIGLFDDYAD